MNENILVDPETEAPEPEQAATPEEVKKPSKFEGKSVDDIIDAYTNLEKEYGRRSSELGQLRNLTDQLLGLEKVKQERAAAEAKPAKKLTSDELFDDPDTAITQKAREIAEARASQTDARVHQLEVALREEVFEKKHPGFRKTVESPEFIEFVNKSPYRLGLVQRAAQDDWLAADELMTAWSESQQVAAASSPSPKKAAKQAGLVKSGGSSAAGVAPRSDGKKIYSRSELIEMRIKDPDGFDERFQSEYLPAYLEGRVR